MAADGDNGRDVVVVRIPMTCDGMGYMTTVFNKRNRDTYLPQTVQCVVEEDGGDGAKYVS